MNLSLGAARAQPEPERPHRDVALTAKGFSQRNEVVACTSLIIFAVASGVGSQDLVSPRA